MIVFEFYEVIQTDNEITLYFSNNISSKINGSVLLTRLFKISQNFNVMYLNGMLKITLLLKNLDRHFIYYLVEMMDIIE